MVTIKLFGLFGIAYLIIGLFNVRTSCGDRFYKYFWGLKPPSNYSTLRLGVLLILLEIIVDLFVNFTFLWYNFWFLKLIFKFFFIIWKIRLFLYHNNKILKTKRRENVKKNKWKQIKRNFFIVANTVLCSRLFLKLLAGCLYC